MRWGLAKWLTDSIGESCKSAVLGRTTDLGKGCRCGGGGESLGSGKVSSLCESNSPSSSKASTVRVSSETISNTVLFSGGVGGGKSAKSFSESTNPCSSRRSVNLRTCWRRGLGPAMANWLGGKLVLRISAPISDKSWGFKKTSRGKPITGWRKSTAR